MELFLAPATLVSPVCQLALLRALTVYGRGCWRAKLRWTYSKHNANEQTLSRLDSSLHFASPLERILGVLSHPQWGWSLSCKFTKQSNFRHQISILHTIQARMSTCYWPNGGGEAQDFTRCDTGSGQSACCASSHYCFSNGLCLDPNQMTTYRGACTDESWDSAACPKYCLTFGEGA